MKLLVVDNYDSFTYNLVHSLRKIAEDINIDVRRNDTFTLVEVSEYDAFVLSPGPGLPKDSGVLCELIREFATKKPILGICLGHEAIGEVFGATLKRLPSVYHGVSEEIHQTEALDPLFQAVPTIFYAGRYHSWVVDTPSLPDCLQITATDTHGEIMAMRHTSLPIVGVQFHPESVLSPQGEQMLSNWIESTKKSLTSKSFKYA